MLEKASESDITTLENLWGRKTPPLTIDEKLELQKLFQKYGTVDFAKKVAEDKVRSVEDRINASIPSSEGRQILQDLLRFYVERTF